MFIPDYKMATTVTTASPTHSQELLDGPVIKLNDVGNEQHMWYRNGVLHREDGGPSFKNDRYGFTTLMWHRNGVLHREDGPAFERHNNINGAMVNKDWFLNGVRVSEEKYNKTLKIIKKAINPFIKKKYISNLKEIDPLGKKGKYDYTDLYNIIVDYMI